MKLPVVVYTTPNCVQCNMTKKVMDKLGIVYDVIDLEQHPEKLAEFKAQGFLAAPIVTTDTKVWSGFKLNKIQSLSNHIRSLDKSGANNDSRLT